MKQLFDMACPSCRQPVRVPTGYGETAVATCRHCGHSFRPKVRIECPHCRFALHAPPDYLGQSITCSLCNHTYQATSKDATPAPAADAGAAPPSAATAPAVPPRPEATPDEWGEPPRREPVAERAPRETSRQAAPPRRESDAPQAELNARLAAQAEQLRSARADVERQGAELAALRREWEAAQADAAQARSQAAHAAEELARLAAAHGDWQEQFDVTRRRLDDERAGWHAEAEQLRRQRDEALRRADALAAERDALAAARQELSGQVETARAEVERLRQGAAPRAAPEMASAKAEDVRRQAVAPARPQERGEPPGAQERLTAAHSRYEEERAAQRPGQRPPREHGRPAAEVESGADTAPRRAGRSPSPLWVCLPLALFLWVASLPTGRPATALDGALRLLFALTLLLQFRLWEKLEDGGDGPQPQRVPAPAPAVGPLHLMLASATAWNAAYLAFSASWPRLGAFAALSVVFLLWYRGLRRLSPGPITSAQVALLKYPALVYLLAAPAVPGGPLLLALALVYLCFTAFELLHEGRLRAAAGSAGILAVVIGLMLGVSGLMAALRERDGSASVISWALLAPGAAALLFLGWRRGTGRVPGAWDYLVFAVGFAWLLSFSLGGR